MLTTIEKATQNFCIHQIREDHTTREGVSDKRTLIAYIDINAENGTRYRVYIASDEAFMQRISLLFLEEQQSDEETLKDMTLETANLIIGSAKVIASKKDLEFTISTPKIERVEQFTHTYEEGVLLICHESHLFVALEKIER